MTKVTILDFLKTHQNEFKEKYGVIKIGLFGSYARGEEKPSSDVDIAVEILDEKKSLHSFFSLKRELEKAFQRKVDLGIESTLKPIAKEGILKDIIYV